MSVHLPGGGKPFQRRGERVYQENEIIMLILSVGVLIFILIYRRQILRMPASPLLLAAFGTLVAASIFTILEGLPLGKLFKLLEHVLYALGSVLLACYVFQVFNRSGSS